MALSIQNPRETGIPNCASESETKTYNTAQFAKNGNVLYATTKETNITGGEVIRNAISNPKQSLPLTGHFVNLRLCALG